MTKDINMQHMTMREYVSISILTELMSKEHVQKAIVNGTTTPKEVVEQGFYWAGLWMQVREERNAKT